jgi:hypothetical protein
MHTVSRQMARRSRPLADWFIWSVRKADLGSADERAHCSLVTFVWVARDLTDHFHRRQFQLPEISITRIRTQRQSVASATDGQILSQPLREVHPNRPASVRCIKCLSPTFRKGRASSRSTGRSTSAAPGAEQIRSMTCPASSAEVPQAQNDRRQLAAAQTFLR